MLQAAPQVDHDAYRRAKAAARDHYGWVDAASGVAHMPVSEAMNRLAQRAPSAPVSSTQRLGASLPLAAPFTDSEGRAVRLGDEFDAVPSGGAAPRPVILVLGYFHCPQLCGLAMQGVLEAAHATGLPATAWRVVFASIDPQDTPADAAARRRVELAYARFVQGEGAAPLPSIDLLIGPPSSLAALAGSIGERYVPTRGTDARFAHPAGIVVVTPGGRVSRYLMGVRYDAGELRAALVEAAGGRIGTFTDRLALLCAHLDLAVGLWSGAVLDLVRIVGVVTMLLLVLLVLRLARGRPR
jgi:protein SCO1/2